MRNSRLRYMSGSWYISTHCLYLIIIMKPVLFVHKLVLVLR